MLVPSSSEIPRRATNFSNFSCQTLFHFFLGYQKLFYQINADLPEVVYVSLLFPARSLKTFRQFLDPRFSPTEVYEFVSVNLETINKHTARFGPS